MKETWERKMQEKTDGCARAGDLVAYLYGEATHTEAREFESHMQSCAKCRTETAAFGDVRESIGEWRQQSLGTHSSPAFESNGVTAFASPREIFRPGRSAFAALREFFTLSPVWMRAATVAVALVFCALVVIAIAHFREQSKAVVAENPETTNVTSNESKPEIVAKDTPSKETVVNVQDQSPMTPQKDKIAGINKTQAPRQIGHSAIGSPQFARKQRQQFLPRNRDNSSAELAENDYLPFTASRNEVKMPSLVDLADEPE